MRYLLSNAPRLCILAYFVMSLLLVAFMPMAAIAGVFDTPVTPQLLDQAATAQWVDGQETPLTDFLDPYNKVHFPNQLTWFVRTPFGRMGHSGITFGVSPQPGVRHLRVGFTQPIPVGTVVARGGGQLSVLKATAPYPGNLADETQWIPAQRARADEVSVWILPPGTVTRALRFSYTSPANVSKHAGGLLGVYVLPGRYENIAPAALPFSRMNNASANKLTDGYYNLFDSWDNAATAARPVISATDPEWVMLYWPKPVTLRGICAVWGFFGKAEVQRYTRLDDLHPREAGEDSWKTITTADLKHNYPETLDMNLIDFGADVTTRALRVRIIAPSPEGDHGDMKGRTLGGRRCWIGELMALTDLGNAPLQPLTPAAAPAIHPPIAIPFTLPAPGYVTLAIDDAKGKRVRNLIGETYFPAGKNVAYWDGLDESGRIEGPFAGIYKMFGNQVGPGTYTVRGLYRKQIDLRYEFSVYSPGTPPWLTGSNWDGGSGGWLSDHGNPEAVLFLPGQTPRILMTSPVAESSHGIIWTDLQGRKLDGKLWVGGNWTGASHLARDDGERAVPGNYAYSGIAWQGELRLTAFTNGGYKTVVPYQFADAAKGALGGLAAHNSLLVASLPKMNQLLFVDVAAGKILGTAPFPDGRGLAFAKDGRLLALSGTRLLRFTLPAPAAGMTLPEPEVVVAAGLEDPQGITLDRDGNVYISDWGSSHQVKVFSAAGQPVRVIGNPGGAKLGPYDPKGMHNPYGITVTSDNHLWVAEDSLVPKRISEWTLDGTLVNAFYGPAQYGGGGTIDPRDPSRFYYAGGSQRMGMEFKLDWKTGTSMLKSIYYLPGKDDLQLGDTGPQTPIYLNGRQYMTDAFNSRPIGGSWGVGIWMMRDGLAVQVAQFGLDLNSAPLNTDEFKARRPKDFDPKKGVSVAWSDLNNDGKLQPDEISYANETSGVLTVNDRLEFCTTAATVYAPQGFTAAGVPIYDLSKGQARMPGFYMREIGSGSGQVYAAHNGWIIATGGPARAIHNGEIVWTYPNEWPGQQAGVFSTLPTHPGELMATTRHMNAQTITVRGSDAGEIWAVNGDKGNVFLMTVDGLFVATLFHDTRLAPATWTMPKPTRNMLLNDVTTYDEDFWTTFTQTEDGKLYIVAGKPHSSIVRVDGLESVKRLPSLTLNVTPALLEQAAQYRTQAEAARLAQVGHDLFTIPIKQTPPAVDGKQDEWNAAEWAIIDELPGRLGQELGKVEATLTVAGDRLYAAYRMKDAGLLQNSGDALPALFKTGGALDLMIGSDPAADPKRTKPVAGDMRLLVTRVKGKTLAMLYRAVVPGTKEPVKFSSPWRTITFDQVLDVSDQVTLASVGGNYEFSIPLATLGLTPKDGLEIRGDLGILRGNGFQTTQRLYWQNKATSTVADVPTEATLTPQLWGRWRFVTGPAE